MTTPVKMERDGKTADVHPDEVDNYSRHGWTEAAKPAAKKAASKPKASKPPETTDE